MSSYLREIAARVIRDVIRRKPEAADPQLARREVLKFFRNDYPFAKRDGWPYKVWLDEIARQTGHKPPLGARWRGFESQRAMELKRWADWQRIYGNGEGQVA